MDAKKERERVYAEVREMFGIVPKWLELQPDEAIVSFWGLVRDFYLAETKIPNKYKELIGLAVSAATRCRYCTLFHSQGAKLNGATDEEIAEATMVGSLTMLGSTFVNGMQVDFEQFKRETDQMIAFAKKHQDKKAPKKAPWPTAQA
jgi:AhpD family alkylhydroperoxidase